MKYIKQLTLIMSVVSYTTLCALKIDKVVIWGHKLHSHTHSYIHWGFYRAFQHMGYDTYWFDNRDNVASFDFSHTLFITEGQVDERIPLRDDSTYILHNCALLKYKNLLNASRCIIMQVYTHDVLARNDKRIDDFIHIDVDNKVIYQPWATDLLPHEIDEIKQKIQNVSPWKGSRQINWVGTRCSGQFGNDNQLNPFIRACTEAGINFSSRCASVTTQENIDLIQKSVIAPAIVGKWQEEKGYIPCRIFKNISYGHMGVTNSRAVYELLKEQVIYNSDTYQLFHDAMAWYQNPDYDQLFALMDLVKEKHTYLNRIQHLLNFLETLQAGVES